MGKKRKITPFDPDEMPKWVSTFWNSQNYKTVIAGINDDDCAIIKIGKEQIVISVDYLNANPIAIEFGIGTFNDLGRLLVAANLSDLCGTGAKPVAFLTAVMFKTKSTNKNDFKQFMKGVKYQLKQYKIPLIGGDTKLGNSNNFCGVAIGIREKGTKLFLRNGAKAGDSIWVSGNIGSVGAAVDGLKKQDMDENWNKWARRSIIKPKLPLIVSRKIAKKKLANAGTDLSDGITADLWAVCQASNVGAILEVNKIPIESPVKEIANKRKIDPWIYAFTVGGDFQFIATASKKNDLFLKRIGMVKIGEIIKEKEAYISLKKKLIIMPKIGHRDSRTSSFSQEVENLKNQIFNTKRNGKK